MAAYRLLLKSSAVKEIEAVEPKGSRRRIVDKIGTLGANPRPYGAETLAGHDDRYRIREGSFRIVYLIDDARLEVTIFKAGHRKDVYR